ncbi:MAG: zinc ABC transporter substrate-binding protein [Acidimicrobiales bacterium]|nr:zinc ABC transporter substrate-binding protein [Acidimicrobiales bacterium]
MTRSARRKAVLAAVLAVAGLGISACGDDDGSGDGGSGAASATSVAGADKPVVVTTVAPITSIAANIVGARARVVGIVPEGTNSHTFEPQPSAAKVLAEADVIFINGLQLEAPTKALAEANKAADAEIVELGSETVTPDEYIYDFSFPKEEGKPNPHLWTNPPMVKRYAEIITERMSALDPAGADTYAANLAAFGAQIDEFDAAMRTAFATIPAANRKLLTYHDAYAYFAVEYGWEVIGAIQVSDFEDPTAKEVADLIGQVKEAGVPAVFGSEVFPSPVLEQIGKEAGVAYVDVLRDDDLPGEPGDPEHSWIGLMRFDFVTMTEALGGDATALKQLDLVDVAPDTAEYPQ